MTAKAKAFNDLGTLEAGQFHYDKKRGRLVFIEVKEGPGAFSGLFVHARDGNATEVISAKNGVFEAYYRPAAHRLVVYDAQVFRTGGGKYNLVGHFDEFTLYLPTAIPESVERNPSRLSNRELKTLSSPEAEGERQWRQSTAISAMLLALLTVPLSRTLPRRGRYSKIMLAVVIYALYYNVLGVARTSVENQTSSYLWWAPALLALVNIVAYLTLGRRT